MESDNDANLEMGDVHNGTTYSDSDSARSSSSSLILPVTEQDRPHRDEYRASEQTPEWFRRASNTHKVRMEKALQGGKASKLMNWLQGPSPSRRYSIKPLFPKLQIWPQQMLCRLGGERAPAIACVSMFFIWLVVFSSVLAISTRQNTGTSSSRKVKLACDTRLWPNAKFCGLDGERCQPFDDSSFSFLCPSGCSGIQVLEPHTIGDQEINYQNMVIGGPSSEGDGPSVYRGDSFICPAAIHAGIISDSSGGCGTLTRRGERHSFPASRRHGISSIEFPSTFPLSFSLSGSEERCQDPQWALFVISCFTTAFISVFTNSSRLFFISTSLIVFFQTALASDPPSYPDFPGILSSAFERLLPTTFILFILHKYCVHPTLHDLHAPLEKSLLWLTGAWIGALNNYTFDKIPISRLTPHDLHQQPGAITALISILTILLLIAIGQIYAFRIEGRLLRYLLLYLTFTLTLAILASIPNLQLRIHHYILALLLLPGTALQTRPSLLYQGILIGLFINGVARWGYDSILQTADALRQDAQLGSALPYLPAPIIDSTTILFNISTVAEVFDGISMLVNDVERFRQSNISIPALVNWTRDLAVEGEEEEALFFRFAFTGTRTLGGWWYGDYTKPGTWFGNGSWSGIEDGASR